MGCSRLLKTLRLYTIRTAHKRAEYLRKKNIFRGIGNNCTYTPRKVPLNPHLIKFGNNVHIASNVEFATHDIVHKMLNNLYAGQEQPFREKLGCIEIGDNVFVGAGTRILYNVKIGNNVVIGASSLVLKDVPDNCVVAGVPARVIGTLDDLVDKRRKENAVPEPAAEDPTEQLWSAFYLSREERTDE